LRDFQDLSAGVDVVFSNLAPGAADLCEEVAKAGLNALFNGHFK
jgi:hypothetical protein